MKIVSKIIDLKDKKYIFSAEYSTQIISDIKSLLMEWQKKHKVKPTDTEIVIGIEAAELLSLSPSVSNLPLAEDTYYFTICGVLFEFTADWGVEPNYIKVSILE